jgi:hypothetical protein
MSAVMFLIIKYIDTFVLYCFQDLCSCKILFLFFLVLLCLFGFLKYLCFLGCFYVIVTIFMAIVL